jgi:ATP-dependent Clp protease ATP-binding subunit ClpB
VTPGALAVIAKNSYDPVYGARPIKRYIQRNLETSIARELIRGNVSDGGRIIVENQGNDAVIHYQPRLLLSVRTAENPLIGL